MVGPGQPTLLVLIALLVKGEGMVLIALLVVGEGMVLIVPLAVGASLVLAIIQTPRPHIKSPKDWEIGNLMPLLCRRRPQVYRRAGEELA